MATSEEAVVDAIDAYLITSKGTYEELTRKVGMLDIIGSIGTVEEQQQRRTDGLLRLNDNWVNPREAACDAFLASLARSGYELREVSE